MNPKNILLATLLVPLLAGLAAGQYSSTDPAALIKRGNALYEKGMYSEAVDEYKRIHPQAGERYSQALYNIGVCYFELWRTSDAIEMYRKADAARPGRYPLALYALGIALEDLNRFEEAKAIYGQAVAAARAEEAGASHFRLGLLLASENDYESAANHFTKAIAGETTPGSHNNLGVMLALKGQLHQAEKHFQVALKQSGGSFDDAAHNLKLCRSMLNGPERGFLASLKAVATRKGLARIPE